jgi:hypothetical protein
MEPDDGGEPSVLGAWGKQAVYGGEAWRSAPGAARHRDQGTLIGVSAGSGDTADR